MGTVISSDIQRKTKGSAKRRLSVSATDLLLLRLYLNHPVVSNVTKNYNDCFN